MTVILGGQRKRIKDFSEEPNRLSYETAPGGNSVVLEEQVQMLNENAIMHKFPSQIYRKNLAMLKLAIGRRQIITFENVLNNRSGLNMVQVDQIRPDLSKFGKTFDPSHPSADENGYVLTPNVNTLIEMMDMREAQRSYEANLNVIKNSKAMLTSLIDILGPQ